MSLVLFFFNNQTLRAAVHTEYAHNNISLKSVGFNIYGNISNWNTSKVTDMSGLFQDLTNFNSDIKKWDTGNVIDMSSMFSRCNFFLIKR